MRAKEFEMLQVEIANDEYEEEKKAAIKSKFPHKITIPIIERRNKLKPGQLISYRANNISRKKT